MFSKILNRYENTMIRFYAFWLFPLLSVGLMTADLRGNSSTSRLTLLLFFCAGAVCWTLIEYLIHRFAFHQATEIRLLQRFQEKTHLHHHDDPSNPQKILVRPAYSVTVSIGVFLLFYGLTGSLAATSGWICGLWLGFLYYESVHYRLHMTRSEGWILRRQRRQHLYHHFLDESRGYGVTSAFWDHMFGTAIPRQKR